MEGDLGLIVQWLGCLEGALEVGRAQIAELQRMMHDLTLATCSICKHGLPPRTDSWQIKGDVFEAIYNGMCSECENEIEIDNPIVRQVKGEGSRYVHAECAK